ncbi:DUF6367 family protein [Acinetobacter baumannii]|uniref:DUF6367 family protein n=1 Tax=Acinetobacter baumannii TaxID=470 RepID=UPI00144A74CD|nr:DUF6367 family protein [Acinetobacter baumannii]NLP55318.1 hypothetical protein [Acinetobacter baumannii]NQE74075.1 hypothetical protein [Acinetobacter baumannii]QNT87648.1 hypothetical protein H0N27_12455 [Acinetobacter baumannii]WEX34702.1 DUF6367 family protein [Acinetobacter baumannii]WEX38075.1 DUF6367 family protein [Acinetobacter baumannii]
MITFKEFLLSEKQKAEIEDEEKSINQILISVPEDQIDQTQLALESIWQSYNKQWSYRIDPPDPRIPLQRHIHIAKTNQTSAKGKQASWNLDGSIHDKHSHNKQVAAMKIVQQIAISKLGVKGVLSEEQISLLQETARLTEFHLEFSNINIIDIQ